MPVDELVTEPKTLAAMQFGFTIYIMHHYVLIVSAKTYFPLA